MKLDLIDESYNAKGYILKDYTKGRVHLSFYKS